MTSRDRRAADIREDEMDRRTVLKTGLVAAGTLAMPAYLRAQSNKTISILTWNIADQEALFKQEFEDFRKANPGVEIEWLDKKGPDLPAFYQTQIVAGTPPDIVDLQGAIWADYAAKGGLVDLTPYLKAEPDVGKRFNPDYLGGWRSEEHTSELQSRGHLVCRLLLEKKKTNTYRQINKKKKKKNKKQQKKKKNK